MTSRRSPYYGYRYPPEIISHAVWVRYRFGLSLRDVEDLLAKRGVAVSYETIRRWCAKFGPEYARRLRKRQGRLDGVWFLDEVFVTINGKPSVACRRSRRRPDRHPRSVETRPPRSGAFLS